MNLKQFLYESYKQDKTLQEAFNLASINCSDALKHWNIPLIRGTNLSGDAYILEGEVGFRKSKKSKNYYTIIFDEILPPLGYPKRSKSIILGNYSNRSYAESYGTSFIILPFNDINIGVCPERDIFNTKTSIIFNNKKPVLHILNDFFEGIKAPDNSYNNLVNYIEKILQNPKDIHYETTKSIFTSGNVDKKLRNAYSPKNTKMKLETSKTVYDIKDKKELWISGKCIAIRKDKYKEFLELLNINML